MIIFLKIITLEVKKKMNPVNLPFVEVALKFNLASTYLV